MYEAAITELTVALETMENNAPINDAAGNTVQAELERTNAASYRAAIKALKESPCH
jgi:hypothetical protein